VPLGVVLAIICAAMIGRVSFRLPGAYFALCTIAFAEVLRLVAKSLRRRRGSAGAAVVHPVHDQVVLLVGGTVDRIGLRAFGVDRALAIRLLAN
jgi:ABC-type branched-subunit amino acid transport system permease subunit